MNNLKALKTRNQLRIIGGQWRSRKLAFPDSTGLRPTPDRVRETLFNWLQSVIHGARCLDLFAGSGALGFEALSRGAAEAVMVDCDTQVTVFLRRHIESLHAQGAYLVQADALKYLAAESPPAAFDIVFLDPPFRHNLLLPCCQKLEELGWLKLGTRIYLEAESELALTLPQNWRLTHSKRAGDVSYYLAVRE